MELFISVELLVCWICVLILYRWIRYCMLFKCLLIPPGIFRVYFNEKLFLCRPP